MASTCSLSHPHASLITKVIINCVTLVNLYYFLSVENLSNMYSTHPPVAVSSTAGSNSHSLNIYPKIPSSRNFYPNFHNPYFVALNSHFPHVFCTKFSIPTVHIKLLSRHMNPFFKLSQNYQSAPKYIH